MPDSLSLHPSSFRDPSGFMFGKDGVLYRQVNLSYQAHFEKFRKELYPLLAEKALIIPHEEIRENLSGQKNWYLTLRPEPLPFISYPCEWSFQMLKDAALLTLRLAKEAMEKGMMLKDATPFNVQFSNGRPVFIDSLSFEIYDAGKPWIAYRQFCETFLSPLLLAHYLQQPVHPLMLAYPEGIPLAFTAAALPRRTRFSLHTYLHIHLHAKTKKEATEKQNAAFSEKKLRNILDSLELAVNKCRAPLRDTAWSGYYEEAAGREDYLARKNELVRQWTAELSYKSAADLGANTGSFSKLITRKKILCIAADADPYCIDELYKELKTGDGDPIQPLVLDLSNPTPAIGVSNRERSSFIERIAGTELVLALALIHHLAIAKNLPLPMIAGFFAEITGKWLLIEFVPKEDAKLKQLLAHREDIFPAYTEPDFEKAFDGSFEIVKKEPIGGSGRTLYLLAKK